MEIQWFPGHMAKAKRILKEDLKLVDVIIEVVDARIPYSSRNPDLMGMIGNKPLLVILNKADLSDPDYNNQWENYFKSKKLEAIAVDSVHGVGISKIVPAVKKLVGNKTISLGSSGRLPRAPRCMIVGIPNVGKSYLINRLSGRKSAKAENKPGVTKGQQWIRVADIELLDTPGILWPKFEDSDVGYRLAVTGAVKEQVYDLEFVAGRLSLWLAKYYPSRLKDRFNLDSEGISEPQSLLEMIGKNRGFIVQGGKVDIYKAAVLLLKEFRGGILGRYTLERPPGK
ncbi:MAG: ribosome biogenesis GTPase YlqF [Peptococcaceae bacterium]|nr:ribosome biogenesis GTPase YlqF [Peptococcaceae bacterium]